LLKSDPPTPHPPPLPPPQKKKEKKKRIWYDSGSGGKEGCVALLTFKLFSVIFCLNLLLNVKLQVTLVAQFHFF
jgi:hypothetical protein